MSLRFSFLLLVLLGAPASTSAQNCQNTSVGLTPINDLGAGSYQGFQGGLYPGGVNDRPAGHEQAGLAEAQQVVPRDAQGQVDLANGRIGLMSIGFSNATQEFSTFIPLANADPQKNPQVTLVDGAQGGVAAEDMDDPNAPYWNFVDQRVAQAGLSSLQVQAIWFKNANRAPTGAFPGHAQTLRDQFRTILQIVRSRFPNVRQAYISSRIYAGYAVTALNPEPWSYESGFAVKMLIEDQIHGAPGLEFTGPNPSAPWLSWGPYTWADGLTPRSDGLIWECSDFAGDGTHPSQAGRDKVAAMLLDHFKADTTSTWFLGQGGPGPELVLDQLALRSGQSANFRVTQATPGERVFFLHSTAGTGMGPCPGKLGGLCLDLLRPITVFGNATADGAGIARLSWVVDPGLPVGSMLHTQAVARRGAGGLDSVKSNTNSAPILP